MLKRNLEANFVSWDGNFAIQLARFAVDFDSVGKKLLESGGVEH